MSAGDKASGVLQEVFADRRAKNIPDEVCLKVTFEEWLKSES